MKIILNRTTDLASVISVEKIVPFMDDDLKKLITQGHQLSAVTPQEFIKLYTKKGKNKQDAYSALGSVVCKEQFIFNVDTPVPKPFH